MLTAFELWTKWIDEGFGVDIVYLDYRKAFDSVDHVKLIEKLFNINIDWKMIKLISAFLHDRTRGQSNLTKSASRGPIPRLGVTPGGRKLYH